MEGELGGREKRENMRGDNREKEKKKKIMRKDMRKTNLSTVHVVNSL